jgi:hypothetical protein
MNKQQHIDKSLINVNGVMAAFQTTVRAIRKVPNIKDNHATIRTREATIRLAYGVYGTYPDGLAFLPRRRSLIAAARSKTP